MKQLKAFKYQITPNGAQIRTIRQYAGNARKVWNLALSKQQEPTEVTSVKSPDGKVTKVENYKPDDVEKVWKL